MNDSEGLSQASVPKDLQDAVDRLLVTINKDLREVVTACSVPNWFNEEIIEALQVIVAVAGDPAELLRGILDCAFVRPYHGLGFAIHEDVRSILEQRVESDFGRALSLHAGMLRFFGKEAQNADGAEKALYIREEGYHARKLGTLYLSHADDGSALPMLSLALESYESVGDVRNCLRTFKILGLLHLHREEIDQAEEAYLTASNLAQELKEADLRDELLTEIGDALAQRNLWDRAADIYAKTRGERTLAALYSAQADYLRSHQEFDAAKEAYLRSRNIFLHLGDGVAANQIDETVRALEKEKRQSRSRLAASPGQPLTVEASAHKQELEAQLQWSGGEGAMLKTLNIFISSTTQDLQPERDAVEQAIAGLRLEAIRSEKVGSQSISPREACLIMAQQCDVYLGILGGRYGHVLREGISATEFEFNRAREVGKPILLYRKDVPEDELELEQKAFIERLGEFDKGYYVHEFTPLDVPDQLREQVQQDIQRLLSGAFRDRMPEARPRPGPRSGRRTLIASLGRAPGTVTGLCHALKAMGKPVDRALTVSTADFQVKRAVRFVRQEMEKEGVAYQDQAITASEMSSDGDVQEFKGAVHRHLMTASEDGDEVCVGIAGGRTVMGALLALVAQLEAPEGTLLYQISVPDDIFEDGQIPRFLNLPPERQREVLQPPDYHMVTVPFVRFVDGSD